MYKCIAFIFTVLGHAFKLYMSVLELPRGGKKVIEDLDKLKSIAKSQWNDLSSLEKGHFEVLQSISKG